MGKKREHLWHLSRALAEISLHADEVGEAGWTVVDGRDHPEHGPGFHVVGAELEVLSIRLGSHDAPSREEARARAEALCSLLDAACSLDHELPDGWRRWTK